MADPKEIHEVIAKAWQDIFRRWDKDAKPTWQNFVRNCPHLWDTDGKWCELQVDQMMKNMKTSGAKLLALMDGRGRNGNR